MSSNPLHRFRTLRDSLVLAMKGFLMGAADIIPGVSGGTMALITGIYQPLLRSIRSIDASTISNLLRLRFKDALSRIDVAFLATLVTGIAAAILFFTKVVPLPRYMVSHPELVYGLFFGLIVGSIVLLFVDIDPVRRKPFHLLFVLLGSVIGFWVVTLVPSDTPETAWFVFLSGAVAICAMILPGISGSFILLILRKYDYILYQIGSLGGAYTWDALLVLIPFGLGALTGLALFSRVLSWLLERAEVATMKVLIGFLIGSLYVIWPWQERSFVESVRSTETLAVSHPDVQALLDREPDPYALRFRRIASGEAPSSDTPSHAHSEAPTNAPSDALSEAQRDAPSHTPSDTPYDAPSDSVLVQDVSRKMSAGKPLWPTGPAFDTPKDVEGWSPRTEGLVGITSGLILTILIFTLRRRS